MIITSDISSIFVCVHKRFSDAPSCGQRGGEDLAVKLEAGISARGLAARVQRIHCLGHCEVGPNVRLGLGGTFIHEVSLDAVDDILDQIADLEPTG